MLIICKKNCSKALFNIRFIYSTQFAYTKAELKWNESTRRKALLQHRMSRSTICLVRYMLYFRYVRNVQELLKSNISCAHMVDGASQMHSAQFCKPDNLVPHLKLNWTQTVPYVGSIFLFSWIVLTCIHLLAFVGIYLYCKKRIQLITNLNNKN